VAQVEMLKKKRNDAIQYQYAVGACLNNDAAQNRYMQSTRYVAVWLTRLVTKSNYPQDALKLPLLDQQPLEFQCLPEYYVENVANVFKYII
jgi:ubiquitin conjugation factor E4 B